MSLVDQIRLGFEAVANQWKWLTFPTTDGVYENVRSSGVWSQQQKHIWLPLAGQFLLDPNEINGWGQTGPFDNSNTLDLGNSVPTPANLNRNAGGYVFPFDLELTRLFVDHRNSNAAAEAWGWVIGRQLRSPPGNTVTTTYVLDEVTDNAGVGPRNYNNVQNQRTDVDLSALPNRVVPAGEIVVLGVSAPTANATNYFVQIGAGYLLARVA